jgi:hypothetical protein
LMFVFSPDVLALTVILDASLGTFTAVEVVVVAVYPFLVPVALSLGSRCCVKR